MSDTDNLARNVTGDITGLEAALEDRANKLAAEHIASGHHARERILADTQQRLQIEKERVVLAANAHADRIYQQQVQAAELELRAEHDRLRSELTDAVIAKLPTHLTALAADEKRYLPLLLEYLREAAQAIERDDLVARFNAHDLQLLQKDWGRYARQAAPGKQLKLSPEPLDCIGGALVSSAARDIRFDNTFEGRMERLEESLRGAVAERLMPQSGDEQHG